MSRLRTLLVLALAATAVATFDAAASPDRAQAVVYWSHGGTLAAANLDGTFRQDAFPTGSTITLRVGSVCGLAVDANDLYWADQWAGTIGRLPLGGGVADSIFITGLTDPCGVAVDGSHVYWAAGLGSTIGRARIDGGGKEPAFVVGTARACGVAVDATHLYWANAGSDTIGRARLDGSEVNQEYLPAPGSPCGVAVDGRHVYWASREGRSIGRADLDGGNSMPTFVAGAGEACGVAVDATHVYWVREGIGARAIGRARLDGSEVNDAYIPDVTGRCSVAVDSRAFTPPPQRSSQAIQFGSLRRGRGASVLLDLHLPGQGSLDVVASGLRRRMTELPPSSSGLRTWRLKLWPGRGNGAARRIRRQLARSGRATAVVKVTYQEAGALPVLAEKTLVLRRRSANTRKR